MRQFILIMLLMITNHCFCQCDTTGKLSKNDSLVIAYIVNLKVDNYKGEKINNFLKRDKIKKYCSWSYIQKIVGVFAGVEIFYKGFIALRIHVSQKESGPIIGKSSDWDFEKIKKFKIYRIEIRDYRNN